MDAEPSKEDADRTKYECDRIAHEHDDCKHHEHDDWEGDHQSIATDVSPQCAALAVSGIAAAASSDEPKRNTKRRMKTETMAARIVAKPNQRKNP